METRLINGIVKNAVLDAILPAGYGYYAHSKGKSLSDTALKGAIIGSGIGTMSSVGDIMKKEVDLNTFLSPLKGGVVGGISAVGGSTLLPLLVTMGKYTDWKKVSKKTKEKFRNIIDRMGKEYGKNPSP